MSGIELQVLWYDDDVLELQVAASNGRFSGLANFYEGHDVFEKISGTLGGFPSSGGDQRDLEFGSFDDGFAGGGVRLRFRTVDDLGHAVVDVEMSTDSQRSPFRSETADFVVPVEAAAVDAFVEAVRTMTTEVGANVRLAASD